jgi:hypothetical protein
VRATAVEHERASGQGRQGERRLADELVGGAGDTDQPILVERDEIEVPLLGEAVACRERQEADVHISLADGGKNTARVDHLDEKLDFRVRLTVFQIDLGQEVDADGVDGGEAKRSPLVPSQRGQAFLQGLDGGQKRAALLQENLARRGEQEPAPPPFEETHLQEAFQLTDAGAHGRLGHVQGLGGGAHALQADDGHEGLQQRKIHEPPIDK